MDATVYWVIEVAIKPGQRESFERLMATMVEATRANEPGTLNYEWTISPDGAACHIYERYVHSAAVMTHLGTFGAKFAPRFMELVKPTRFVVYGTPSAQVKEALAALGPVYMAPLGGFHR